MESAPSIGFWPFVAAYGIENTRSSGILTLGRHDVLLSPPVSQRFRGRVEARAHQDSLGTQHKRCRKTAPVRYAPGS
jgi:hypothetical protein